MFRELMATEHFLGTLQEEALRLYPLQATTAGLTGDDETDEPATAAGTIPNRLKSVPIRPTKVKGDRFPL